MLWFDSPDELVAARFDVSDEASSRSFVELLTGSRASEGKIKGSGKELLNIRGSRWALVTTAAG